MCDFVIYEIVQNYICKYLMTFLVQIYIHAVNCCISEAHIFEINEIMWTNVSRCIIFSSTSITLLVVG